MKAKTIYTDRLILKRLTTEHLSQEYVDWMNDTDVNKYLESGGDYTIEKLAAFLKEQEKKDILFWAIYIKASGKHIGNIKIDPLDELNNSGEYGILMGDKKQWGKGYAKEVSIAVIEFCFQEMGLNEITLGVVDTNQAALKLYEKIGFIKTEELDNIKLYDGKKCKTIRMSIYK